MHHALPTARRLLATAAAFLLPVVAQAGPETLFVPFDGAGNVSVFDAAAGTGGWTGSIDQSPVPAVPAPLSLVPLVLFTLNASTMTLAGNFEFTTTDLASSLFGDVSGSIFDADILQNGGQFSIDYSILGGTGAFTGATGYGLSFVDFNPAGTFNNYSEAGALVITTVPEPATLLLAGLALLAALAATPRQRDTTTPLPGAA